MLDIPNIQAASPERVEEIRKKYAPQAEPSLGESLRREPKEVEIVQGYLNKFIFYRHSYLNEIPKNILKPGDLNYELYKCRGAWWTIISGNIQNARDAGLFHDAAILQKVQNFLDYIKSVQARRSEHIKQGLEYRYSKEDINGADMFLDQFIAYFSQRAVEAGAKKSPPATA